MIVGASANRAKFGNKAVRAFLRQGHVVFPVNHHEHEIEAQPVFTTIDRVPGPIDRALFYVPPDIGLKLIDQLAARNDVSELWLNPGAESPELIRRATELGLAPILACSIVAIGESP